MMIHRILLVDTNYPINSRNQRLIDSLIKNFGENNIRYVAWNRQNADLKGLDNQYIFNCYSPLGQRIRKLQHLRRYANYINDIVLDFKPTVIIASHWDSLIICRKYARKGIKIIYENIDMPSGNIVVRNILRAIERWSLRSVTAISHASRFFQGHYAWFKGKQIVVENLPVNIPIQHSPFREGKKINSDTLNIVFNGGLRYAETMIRLITAIGNNSGIRLDIYGGAIGKEGDAIISSGSQYSNISFHGKYQYDEIGNIIKNADLIWAVYPSSNFNVKYAISNKFHESLYYGIPGVYSKNTLLGELVSHNKIGFVVDDLSIASIKECLEKISNNKKNILAEVSGNIEEYRKSQPRNWDEVYISFHQLINEI